MIWAKLQKHQSLRLAIPGQPHQGAVTATDNDGVPSTWNPFSMSLFLCLVGNLGLI